MAREEKQVSSASEERHLAGDAVTTESFMQGMQPSERPLPPEIHEDGATANGAPSAGAGVPAASRARMTIASAKKGPSFDQLLQCLMLQQESIRYQQLHLQDMSSTIDSVMRGDVHGNRTQGGVAGIDSPSGEGSSEKTASSAWGVSAQSRWRWLTHQHSFSQGQTPMSAKHSGSSGSLQSAPSLHKEPFPSQPHKEDSVIPLVAPASALGPSIPAAAELGFTTFRPQSVTKQVSSPKESSGQAFGAVVSFTGESQEVQVAASPSGAFSGKPTERARTKGMVAAASSMHSGYNMGSLNLSYASASAVTDNYWFHREPHLQDSDVLAVAQALGQGEDSVEALRKMAARVKNRLGITSGDKNVTPWRLHKTLRRLGARRYSLADCGGMLNAVSQQVALTASMEEDREYYSSGTQVLSFSDFASILLLREDELMARFKDHRSQDMVLTVREILTSGDANRLVAELTQVHVDDLAQPPRVDRLAEWMEPVMSVVIILNCAAIGWQANEFQDEEKSAKWFWVHLAFTILFLIELILKLYNRGTRWFMRGPDRYWNGFDSLLVSLGFMDVLVTTLWEWRRGTAIFSVLRIVRLTRLGRLFLVFKMKQMKELSLMLLGVIAGMRTLLWAIILLFTTVFILGVFATLTLGGKPPPEMETDFYASVPISMFTVFRCLMNDCIDERGRPVVYMYAQEFGVAFVLGYVASTTVIVFGVFNLIFAIYIESTLAAAKSQRKMDRHESVRVARLARELLKKFAMAQTLTVQMDAEHRDSYGDSKEFRVKMRGASNGMQINSAGDLLISKETFTMALKDPEVQGLLDALDIASDRMHLFDILDADGSGDIEASELIRGLLRVRGEAKKSDVVANLLAVRAAQNMLRRLEQQAQEFHNQTMESLRVDAA
eukprot:CAMPEP_0178383472 /NCGR_PEP_ID=MMETSP0689_2-20121128/7019_1 /TAXON_ID=160604 /ORGANISM="Amphidinium massartii, Strain CS-259" /LENGTH=892 /DNA_ID=CAMNT_0020003693 /DNA_START=47 /DNA_END=2722 /DNA_ORIENTATION=-